MDEEPCAGFHVGARERERERDGREWKEGLQRAKKETTKEEGYMAVCSRSEAKGCEKGRQEGRLLGFVQ